MKIYSLVLLMLITILGIYSQNLNIQNNKKVEKNKFIPGYPTNSDTTSSSSESNDNGDIPGIKTGMATGVSFEKIGKDYYGLDSNKSYSNVFLEYPEPIKGWEEDELCQNSAEQSPINIPFETDFNIIKDGKNIEILSIEYNYLQSGTIQYQQNHMWGIGILNGGGIKVKIDKNTYNFYLSEIYFHLNSEHKLQNKQYPIEMQLVHFREDQNKNIEKLITSFLFDYSNDIENELLTELKVGLFQEIQNADFSEIFKKVNSFYYYKGGLTIPPCTNNVHWIICKDIQNMSYIQFERIRKWIEGSNKYYYSTGYGNARGIKPINGRKIYYESKLKLSTKFIYNGTKINTEDSGNFLQNKLGNLSRILMILSLLLF